MFGSLYIRFNNAFFCPGPEPPIIDIRYGWSGVSVDFRLCSLMFSFVIQLKLKIFVLFYYIITFNFPFSYI